ncbi:hypothetical protein LTR10_011537 [Elasticomyces elasticus]|uniref:DUF3669 domain-containing protein n=1 Tax=Exophiala sideris TaxID=1016849 RepID=A0ABR0JDD2_9EURO|nr:hypothetical protein LTR10_011537 [Elasticomyces elasticus]KAK5032005.1 hypothetical protein LTS07_004627 [Exophiala sideris]KAK5040934.1 hypothetical protein LTR13_003236 [Exophiala sideris]KAK5061732.1 hypothetical protein LTR69_004914 [Exophiala sideris]KAK5184432.1 hypothetical protein LTR44_003105 [Eurotiomycetes sp. CCFEE 6388]
MPDEHHTTEPFFRDIGRGTCGSVFECPGTAWAIKKGANVAAISNDYNLTDLAYNSYRKSLDIFANVDSLSSRRIPRVPRALFYDGPTSGWWTANLSRFPDADQTRGAGFNLTYIPPVLESTREALVDTFFQKSAKTKRNVLCNPENRDCLVRLYLGKNSPSRRKYDSTDTLRNFPLYLDHARVLMSNLVIDIYAQEMAIGLAILHWHAQIDAHDTEFVIGFSGKPLWSGTFFPGHCSFKSPLTTCDGSVGNELWMLDYDKCTQVDLKASDCEIIKKYLVAVTGNDPYYPHPRLDDELWRNFRFMYLRASRAIIGSRQLGERVRSLPDVLIEQWEQWGDIDFESNDDDIFERVSSDNEEEEYVHVNMVERDSGSDEEDSDDDSEEDYISIEAYSDI